MSTGEQIVFRVLGVCLWMAGGTLIATTPRQYMGVILVSLGIHLVSIAIFPIKKVRP